MGGHYFLLDRTPVPIACDPYTPEGIANLLTWARWFETAERRVALDYVGPSRVSTVFLGLDHNFWGGTPLLFETMAFNAPLDADCERCSSWEEAERQHERMVAQVYRAFPVIPRLFYWWTRAWWQEDALFWRARNRIIMMDLYRAAGSRSTFDVLLRKSVPLSA